MKKAIFFKDIILEKKFISRIYNDVRFFVSFFSFCLCTLFRVDNLHGYLTSKKVLVSNWMLLLHSGIHQDLSYLKLYVIRPTEKNNKTNKRI